MKLQERETVPSLPGRERCSGCTACYAICPQQAIRMTSDDEGFLQPVIDQLKCIKCKKCEHICPVLNPNKPRQPISVYAARALDDNLRLQSSSGGVFSLLAYEVLNEGGVVFGAGWDPTGTHVMHKSVESIEGLSDLRKSKYVQSDMGDCFSEAKEHLKSGRKVLFSGCPCQVDGLKRYVGLEDANLLCVEIICNSVPSPLFMKQYCSNRTPPLVRLEFRNKELGWHKSLGKHIKDDYYWLWQTGVTVRRSCRDCASKSFRSMADLTIGDAWGIEKYAPEMDDNKGTSICFLNTELGDRFFSKAIQNMRVEKVSYLKACVKQPCLHGRFAALDINFKRRERFFRNLKEDSCSTEKLAKKVLNRPLHKRIMSFLGRYFRMIRTRVG